MRAGGPMDRAVDATATEQALIRRIDYRVNLLGSDITTNDLNPHPDSSPFCPKSHHLWEKHEN